MPENNIAISVNHLSKVYKLYNRPLDRLKEAINPFSAAYHNDFYALNDVNLQIPKGSVVGIIGKNGSGKSTLLKVISGVLTPSIGSVVVNGKVAALLELGAGFNPDFTGLENIYFNGMLLGYRREELDSKLDKILEFADIGDFIYQPVRSYSSGMFVRLAFGVAITVDPDILIVDEALAVGDIKFQRKCFSKIEQLHEKGKTILFVTHGLDTVNILCDYAYLLDSGKVIDEGLPKHITRVYHRMMIDTESGVCTKMDRSIGNEVHDISPHPCIDKKLDFKHGDAFVNTKIEQWDGQKKAEIVKYGILDEGGNEVTLLECGEKYRFFCQVLLHEDMDSIHVGFPVKNVKGLLVFGVNSEIQRVQLPPQKKGNIIEGCADVTMWLAPGNYFLSFRAATRIETFDEVTDQVHFVVVGEEHQLNTLSIVNLQPRVSLHSISLYS